MAVVPMRKSKAADPKLPAKPYEPTEREAVAIAKYEAGRLKRRLCPKLKAEMAGQDDSGRNVCNISIDHSNPATGYTLMIEALSAHGGDGLTALLDNLGSLAQRGGEVDVKVMNHALALVRGIEPRDQVEAMLGIQMAAIQMATMTAAQHMAGTNNLEKWQTYERALNRLARTFAAQMEGLKRYRSKGEQRVYVERVNVEQGGQAIVGNVGTGDRGRG